MQISYLVLVFITKFAAFDCLLYELVGQGLLNGLLSRPPPWVPKLNPIFVGLDLDDIKSKFLGAKPFLDLTKLKTALDTGLSPKEPQLGTIEASTFWRRKRAASAKNNLPTSFDWRQSTKCKSFMHVRKQSCSDCWAVSSAAAISDRYCLYTNQNLYFSARELGACVYKGSGGGCDGGYASDAFQFFKKTGIVQGGDPTLSDEPKGCLPYQTMTSKSVCPMKCDDGSAFGGMKSEYGMEIVVNRFERKTKKVVRTEKGTLINSHRIKHEDKKKLSRKTGETEETLAHRPLRRFKFPTCREEELQNVVIMAVESLAAVEILVALVVQIHQP
uniref:Peptidase C1A papain C-terminal domain-containing protein n=1 Tax=Romanomermis culicivorax TaxID=13658 RepID=A0A915I2Z3_ROMCU